MKRLLLRRCLLAPSLMLLCSLGLEAQVQTGTPILGTGAVQTGNTWLHVVGTLGQSVTGLTSGTCHHTWQGFWAPELSGALSSLLVAGDTPVPSLHCAPNPATTSTTIELTLSRSAHVMLTLHDMLGRSLLTLSEGEMKEGTSTFAFNTQGLDNGWYTIVMATDSGRLTLPIHVIR